MKYTIRFYEAGATTEWLKPLTLNFASAEKAREAAKKASEVEPLRKIFVNIDSEDGSVSERWYRGVEGWRRA